MKAYSLLELSIVVVIMALMMAGISSGQAILKKAKLHGAITELKEIEASIILFKENSISLLSLISFKSTFLDRRLLISSSLFILNFSFTNKLIYVFFGKNFCNFCFLFIKLAF